MTVSYLGEVFFVQSSRQMHKALAKARVFVLEHLGEFIRAEGGKTKTCFVLSTTGLYAFESTTLLDQRS